MIWKLPRVFLKSWLFINVVLRGNYRVLLKVEKLEILKLFQILSSKIYKYKYKFFLISTLSHSNILKWDLY